MKTLVVLSAIGLAVPTFANDRAWTIVELKDSHNIALTTFKKENGEKLYGKITGFTMDLDGNASEGQIRYEEDGKSKSVDYSCESKANVMNCSSKVGPTPALANARGWTIVELKKAQDIALTTFRKKLGEKAYGNITGFTMDLEGKASEGEVRYTEGGKAKSVDYFCHYHEADVIDCH